MSDATFTALLTQSVHLNKMAVNTEGDLAPSVVYYNQPCAVEFGSIRRYDREGQQRVAQAIVYFDNDSPIDAGHNDWRIERDGVTHEVVQIDEIRDHDTGDVHHYEVAIA